MDFKLHWLAVTVWGDVDYALKMWEEWFQEFLGEVSTVGHGGRGFREVYQGLAGAKIYCSPVGDQPGPYFHIELPGNACDGLPDKLLQEFVVTLERFEKYKVTRLDLAWDNIEFTPLQVKVAVEQEQMRSLLKRRTLKFWVEPFEERENGEVGTSSLSLGSRTSERMLRVYDKHGPVRLEFQTRDDRAHLIAKEVVRAMPDKWSTLAIGHLRDYLDFESAGNLVEWWAKFVTEINRAGKTISDVRQLELARMTAWLMNQVSPTLSVAVDLMGENIILGILAQGRKTRGPRFRPLLSGMSR